MITEVEIGPKPGVGTLKVVFDAEDPDNPRVCEMEWGEFEDLSGERHGPLSPEQIRGIMQLARNEEQAMLIVHHG